MDHHDHSAHGGHGGAGDGMMADGGPMCKMSMLFTWDYMNMCVVFRWWHVTSLSCFLVTLVSIVLLSMGYEYLRELTRRFERRTDGYFPISLPDESSSLLPGPGPSTLSSSASAAGNASRWTPKKARALKGVLYGLQVFYSFFIMLLFMTYNGWVMIAVAVGAALGYIGWGGDSSPAKTVACH